MQTGYTRPRWVKAICVSLGGEGKGLFWCDRVTGQGAIFRDERLPAISHQMNDDRLIVFRCGYIVSFENAPTVYGGSSAMFI